MGAWIETTKTKQQQRLLKVTPHAGAWIETVPLRDDGKLWIVTPGLGVWAGLWFMRLACVVDLGA